MHELMIVFAEVTGADGFFNDDDDDAADNAEAKAAPSGPNAAPKPKSKSKGKATAKRKAMIWGADAAPGERGIPGTGQESQVISMRMARHRHLGPGHRRARAGAAGWTPGPLLPTSVYSLTSHLISIFLPLRPPPLRPASSPLRPNERPALLPPAPRPPHDPPPPLYTVVHVALCNAPEFILQF